MGINIQQATDRVLHVGSLSAIRYFTKGQDVASISSYFLLKEDGDYILQENADKIIIDQDAIATERVLEDSELRVTEEAEQRMTEGI